MFFIFHSSKSAKAQRELKKTRVFSANLFGLFSEQTLSYQSNLPFLALDLLLPLSCVWGSAQFENILSHVYSTLWYGRWENSVQFFSNEFSKTSIYKHYFTSLLDILSEKGFYLFCVKKLLTMNCIQISNCFNKRFVLFGNLF